MMIMMKKLWSGSAAQWLDHSKLKPGANVSHCQSLYVGLLR
jgi:hypothetical protein